MTNNYNNRVMLDAIHQAIKDEFIPTVFTFSNADGIANDAVVVDTKGEQAVAELLCRYEILGY